ncbi:MAG: DUF3667 domain-containing protein [Bacteroidia bacterium]|nr:DUF3667 domain-containing protein [Bacteroidia bacterium]NNL32927.1 DUF3667 domain-containing protein [Flavobacteriaceae bacterium]
MHCKNCQTPLTEKSDFCHSCGAKVIRNRLTLRNLFANFSEQFLNYDNQFIQTIQGLIMRPEDVIVGYVNGVRKKYINPVSFFAISLTISGLYLFILQRFFSDVVDFSSVMEQNQASLRVAEKISSVLFDYNSLFYFAIIPLLALVSLIVFYNKKFNYTEHIVIYLYTMSLGAVLTSIIALLMLLIVPEHVIYFSLISNLGLFIYHCYLLKRVFKLKGPELLLKTFIFLVIFGIGYVIFSILLVFVLIAFTDISLQDFAQPPKS